MVYYGYVFEKDGTHYGRIELDATNYEEIAKFINNNPEKDKMITDVWDLPVLTTIGNFLDRMDTSKVDRSELLKELMPLQQSMFCE